MPCLPDDERKKIKTMRTSTAVIKTPANSGSFGKRLRLCQRYPWKNTHFAYRCKAMALPRSSAKSVAIMAISAKTYKAHRAILKGIRYLG